MTEEFCFTVDVADEKKRIDVLLAEKMSKYSRSYLKKGIKEGWVRINGKVVKPNYKVKPMDIISVSIPLPEKPSLEPEVIPLNVIYEDEDIIIVNKPRGLVVHPAPGNYSGTLVNSLLYHAEGLSGISGVMRPGIVHRLDKDTSGVMVVAKNDMAHAALASQIRNKMMKKIYRAIVWGVIQEDKATIDAPIGRHPIKRKEMTVTTKNSKAAITHFCVLERFSEFTWLEIRLETGRTHQIRVHMKYINHPVVGDPVYSKRKNPFDIKGQALHSYKLGLYHPRTREYMEFTAPIPEDMLSILRILKSRSDSSGGKSSHNG